MLRKVSNWFLSSYSHKTGQAITFQLLLLRPEGRPSHCRWQVCPLADTCTLVLPAICWLICTSTDPSLLLGFITFLRKEKELKKWHSPLSVAIIWEKCTFTGEPEVHL